MNADSQDVVGRPQRALERTSVRIREARGGDRASVGWLVHRYTPLLLAQARYRLKGPLARLYDPQDLVSEVWAAVLPRLPQIRLRREGQAAAFTCYLSRTLLRRIRDLVEKHIVGNGAGARRHPVSVSLSALPAEIAGPVTEASRKEVQEAVNVLIEGLEPRQREIVILRGIEQHPVKEVAAVCGLPPNTVSVIWRRTLERLRCRLSPSMLELLAGPD